MAQIITVCYDKKQIWHNIEQAISFFREAVMCSDGSERERYMNILMGLTDDGVVCYDDGSYD